jgi:Zn-finger nucleic acid-binding protein
MAPYRDAHRACPRCNHQLRAFRDRLVCDACNGVMLSFGDLAVAIEELTGLLPELLFRRERRGKRPCPHCQTAMTSARLTIVLENARPIKPEPELDRCATHGLWFDDEELALVLAPVAGKGFGGGAAHPKSVRTGRAMGDPRSFNFKIGGRGWGM